MHITKMSSIQQLRKFILTKLIKLKQRQYFKSAQLNQRWAKHLAEVESNQVYYKSPHHLEARSRRVRPRWTEKFGVPCFWVLLWFIQSTLVVLGSRRFPTLTNTPFKRMLLGIEIIPFEIRKNYGIIIFMIATLSIMGFIYETFCPLARFNFLSILACKPNGRIKPKHLRLEEICFFKFTKLRRLVERVYHIGIVWTTISVSIVWTIRSILCNAFAINWALALFQIVSAYFWVISMSQGNW